MIFLLTWSAFIKRLKSAYAVTFFRICSIRWVVRLGTEIEVGLQPSNIKQLKQLLEGKQALKWDFYTQVWCTVTQLPIYRRFLIRNSQWWNQQKIVRTSQLTRKTLLYNIMVSWYHHPRKNFIYKWSNAHWEYTVSVLYSCIIWPFINWKVLAFPRLFFVVTKKN